MWYVHLHKLKKKNERKFKASTAAALCVAGRPFPSTCGHQHSDPSLPGVDHGVHPRPACWISIHGERRRDATGRIGMAAAVARQIRAGWGYAFLFPSQKERTPERGRSLVACVRLAPVVFRPRTQVLKAGMEEDAGRLGSYPIIVPSLLC